VPSQHHKSWSFFVLNNWRWKMIIRFFILITLWTVDYHYISFLFIIVCNLIR
jgi:hypothetical protein